MAPCARLPAGIPAGTPGGDIIGRIVTGAGRRIFYDEAGSGPPIVLIPGHGGDRRGYLSLLAGALAPRFRVVSMDNRDAGESDLEPGYYTLADMAGDVERLLDALGIDRAHVLGYSMGGKVALQFALDHPGRVDRLVLVSARAGDGQVSHRAGEPLPPPSEGWTDDPVERMRRVVDARVGSRYQARMGEAEIAAITGAERGNRATWAGVMRQEAALDGHTLARRLGEIAMPTLVIRGDEDTPAYARALAGGIPNARLLILPGVGHLPWVEAPDEMIPATVDFLHGDAPTRTDGPA